MDSLHLTSSRTQGATPEPLSLATEGTCGPSYLGHKWVLPASRSSREQGPGCTSGLSPRTHRCPTCGPHTSGPQDRPKSQQEQQAPCPGRPMTLTVQGKETHPSPHSAANSRGGSGRGPNQPVFSLSRRSSRKLQKAPASTYLPQLETVTAYNRLPFTTRDGVLALGPQAVSKPDLCSDVCETGPAHLLWRVSPWSTTLLTSAPLFVPQTLLCHQCSPATPSFRAENKVLSPPRCWTGRRGWRPSLGTPLGASWERRLGCWKAPSRLTWAQAWAAGLLGTQTCCGSACPLASRKRAVLLKSHMFFKN